MTFETGHLHHSIGIFSTRSLRYDHIEWEALVAAARAEFGPAVRIGLGAGTAVGETVILLHPPLPSVGVSIGVKRGGAAK